MVDNNEEIDVPSYFLCPISLQIMKDPVTVCTGITYDRESIEKWVFTNKHNTCPVTKQALNVETNNRDIFLTPNHTLRRLIQSWCALNASYGVERFPTPKPQVSKAEVLKLVNEASNMSPQRLIKSLEKIKSIAAQSDANKRCLESTPGVAQFLAKVIILGENDEGKDVSNNDTSLMMMRASSVSDEALRILDNFQVFDEMVLKNMLKEKEGGIVDALVRVMKKSNNEESRGYAVGLMKQLVQAAQPNSHELAALIRPEHFVEIVTLIKDNVSPKATKAGLRVLAALACASGSRNRVRAVEAGAVPVMVGLLLESNHRRTCEMVLAVLDHLSGCAEGRAELLGHPAGLAVVSKKILRVSSYATQRGVKILFAVSKFSGSPSVVQEMLQIGVVTKLCLVLQVECEAKIKEKAREILKLHARAWRKSPCAPPHIFPSIS